MERKTYLFAAALLFLITLLGGAALVLGLQSQLVAGERLRGPLLLAPDTWGLIIGVSVAVALLGAYILRHPALLQPPVGERGRALSQYKERLSYQSDERRRSEAMLRRVGQLLARSVPVNDFSSLVAEMAQVADADWAAMARLQESANNWRLTGVSVACDGIDVGLQLPVRESALSAVLSGSRCLVSEGAMRAYADDMLIQRLGIEAVDLLPLRNTEGRVVGALMFAFASARGQDAVAASVAQILARHCELLWARNVAEESLRVVLDQMKTDDSGSSRALRDAVEMLQRQVTVRLEAERTLRDELDRANANAASKDLFLASMCHEIRTPMSGLLGMLTLLRHTALQRDQSEYLARAMESGDTLRRAVNDVLELSKFEAGRMSLEPAPFDLCDLLEGVAQSAAPAAAGKGIDITVEYTAGPDFELLGDSVRLRQLLNNFVVNAINHTDSGTVALVAAIEKESASEVTLRLSVRDTGCGIPCAQIAHIFENYTQGVDSTGTGLGLAINREIARLMDAEIGVDSDPNSGSEFWLRLTLAKSGAACTWSSEASVAPLAGVSVMLAMSASPLRGQAEEIFARWGMPTATAESTANALAWCREQTASPRNVLLLLESGASVSEATELLQGLGKLPGSERIAVVMLAVPGQMDEVVVPQVVHKSVTIFSPIRRNDLLAAITALSGEPAPAEIIPPRPEVDYDFGALRVLVVEDNPINMQVAVGYLRKLGIEPVAATDGEQAVVLNRQQPFDLILMDCLMPQLDGYQATAQIRMQERDSDRHVPIVAMTASALAGDRDRCLRAGMDGYLAKPITLQQLAHAMRHQLADGVPQDDGGTLDYAAVRALRDIMGKGFPALVGEFIFDGERQLRGMHACLQRRELDELACRAESLRDACLSVGASGLVPLLSLFAERNRRMPDAAETLLLSIDEHFAKVKLALSQTIGRHATLSSSALN